jgi:small-conductance mechanosensitive channel
MIPHRKPHFHPYTINALLIGLLVSVMVTFVLYVLTGRPLTSVILGLVPLSLAIVALQRLFKHEARAGEDDDRDIPPPLDE